MSELITETKRVDWIDICKGIAIFLMVCGHTAIPASVSKYIWSFHMPLFFLISGYLYNADKYTTLTALLQKRFHSLVIPYIVFSLLTYFGLWGLNIVNTSELYLGWEGIALWFIPVLLGVEILYNRIYWLKERIQKSIILPISIVIFCCLGFILSKLDIHFPFKLDCIFFAYTFYGIGNLMREKLMNKIGSQWYIGLLMVIINFIAAQYLPKLGVGKNEYGLFPINVILAVFGTISIIIISKFGEKKNNPVSMFFRWAGKSTLIIMGMSQVLNMRIKEIYETFAFQGAVSSISRHFLLWGLLFIFTLIFNKYLPFFIGKSKK